MIGIVDNNRGIDGGKKDRSFHLHCKRCTFTDGRGAVAGEVRRQVCGFQCRNPTLACEPESDRGYERDWDRYLTPPLKILEEVKDLKFDLAVTLCDRARMVCSVIPCAKRTIHRGYPDPHLAPGTDAGYRRVRDDLAIWIDKTFGN